MRICVLFTGGTIGSASCDGVISPDKNNRFKLIDMFEMKHKEDVTWDCREVYTILSENLDGEHLSRLIAATDTAIKDSAVDGEHFDGIIITHGTDSLAFSAAMLECVFSDVNIPIMLVSSDYCLEDERANGLVNFEYAVRYIKEHQKPGVYVSYCNKGGVPTIHRGSCLQNPISYSADVLSIMDMIQGCYMDGKYQINDKANWMKVENRLAKLRANVLTHLNKSDIGLDRSEEQIFAIRAVPGLRYPTLSKDIRVVILEGYHSGTICIDERLKRLANDARELGIEVILIGLADTGEEYETVEEYRKLGIKAAMDESFVSVYCRSWLSLACAE